MYYKRLRDVYRQYEPGATHRKIASVLGSSEYYAQECLRTGRFTIQDKLAICEDLGVDDPVQISKLFPVLGE